MPIKDKSHLVSAKANNREGLKHPYVLESVVRNWLAMLRSVKSVPGFALKIVPSLTRLSEQPINMNGGAGEDGVKINLIRGY